MTFDFLYEFVTLAETRNYSVAAEQLYTTEASLSRHIKKLEQEIGGLLFSRTTRKIELTALGKALLPYAQQSVELKKQMDAEIANQLRTDTNRLRIAAISTTNTYIDLPTLLSRMQTFYPDISISFMEPEDNFHSLFTNGLADLGLMHELVGYEDKRYERFCIATEKLVVLMAPSNSLNTLSKISIMDLQSENIILINNNSPIHQSYVQICKNFGIEPKIMMSLNSGDDLAKTVKSGLGISLLTEHSFRRNFPKDLEDGNLVMRPIDPPFYLNFNLIYPRKPSPAASAFGKILREDESLFLAPQLRSNIKKEEAGTTK